MPLPESALSLHVHSNAVQSKPKRAMIVRMSAETLDALDTFPNHPPLSFTFGDAPVSLSLSLPLPCQPPRRASTSAMPSFRCAPRRRAPPMSSTSVPPPPPDPWPPSSSMPTSSASSWSSASSGTRSPTGSANRQWSQSSSTWSARPSSSTSPSRFPDKSTQSARHLGRAPSSRRRPLRISPASPPRPPPHARSPRYHNPPRPVQTSAAVSSTISPCLPAFPMMSSRWSVAPT